MYRLIVAMAALPFLAHPAPAGKPDENTMQTAAMLRDTAMAGNSVAYEIVTELTTRIGPRPVGSKNMVRAKDWAVAKMKALGFDAVAVQEYSVPLWTRGRESAAVTVPSPQPLAVTALGFSVATPDNGIEADIALFRTYEEMLAMPAGSLRGKIAVVTQRLARTQDGAAYGALYAMRGAGASEAAQRGAVAYLIRSFGTGSHRFPHTGTMAYADGAPKIPAAALSNPDADQLERLVKAGEAVRVKLISTPQSKGMTTAWNIVGDVRGSAMPEEVILLGAHLDSWDLGTGAVDDGAGVAIVLAAAKMIADLPGATRRSIRVVLFGAEEVGPNGAGAAYVAANHGSLDDVVIASESDFGAGPVYSIAFPDGVHKEQVAQAIIGTLAPINVYPSVEPAISGGPDLTPMHEKGVPAVRLFQDGTDYFNWHHTADDTLDKIDPRSLDQNVAAWAAMAYLFADSDPGFSRDRK